MRLSWNEVRVRAARFADEWQDAASERGETQSFYNAFFRIFGVRRRSVARYEEHVRRLDKSSGFIDLFWPGVLIVEQKSAGRDLARAYGQAGKYFDGLAERERPRYILVSDFQTFELHDLDEREKASFALADLPAHVEKFGFILGIQRRTFRDQDPVNIDVADAVGKLHDALKASGYVGHDLEVFLVRTVFCLFADDTGIFEPRDIFLDLLETRTREDGSDLGGWLARLFQVLNTPVDQRQARLDEDLARFPYVNGDLFKAQLTIADFDADMRAALIDACRFDWAAVSPAIFGALFQSVMDSVERRAQGAHYTTEKNILKVIEPLFLDDLREEFKRLRERRDTRRRSELEAFHKRLGKMKFFDPACGCGNFLIIAYRELRELEIKLIRELHRGRQRVLDIAIWSRITVDQFYGIEIGEFPARIAETALWMMDHIMNNRLSLAFGRSYVRIPLEGSPHILNTDALETDWTALLPPEDCSYVFGNPPFVGAKFQTNEQRSQVRRIAALGKTGGTLDYVGAWFLKAGEYVRTSRSRIGFVATNSITQGEQVAQLWPLLFVRTKLEIAFAHRTFAWGSDALGKAHVHVVIVGLDGRENAPPDKRLFSYPDINGEPEETLHAALSPYLFGAGGLANPQLTVREETRTINGMGKLASGSQPIDGGHYIFTALERSEFLKTEPNADPFLRPYVGAREYLQGSKRWILALQEASPTMLRDLPRVQERMRAVRKFRSKSKRKSTLAIADFPTRYNVELLPTTPFLVIPETSSERREYVPIGWLAPPVIPSNLVRILKNATLADFALLTSTMHMAWLRYVGGRLESRYRYSIGLVYNTFPLPPQNSDWSRLGPPAQAVLDARAAHPGASLADLYNPDLMPPNLRRAHQRLDRAVDRLYRPQKFSSEGERIEYLFGLYEKLRTPLGAKMKTKPRRRQIRRTRIKSSGRSV